MFDLYQNKGNTGLAPWQDTPFYKQNGGFSPGIGNWQADGSIGRIKSYMGADMESQRQMRMKGFAPTGQDAWNINHGMLDRWNNGGLRQEYGRLQDQFAIENGKQLLANKPAPTGGGFDIAESYAQQAINRGKGGFFSSGQIGSARGPGGGVTFGEGNQSGNMLRAFQQMGMSPSKELMQMANTQDALYDIINPMGIMPPVFALGSKEGMGGVGSGALSQVAESPYVDPKFVTYAPGRGNYNGPTSNAPPPKPAGIPVIPGLGRSPQGQPAPAENTRPVPARIFPQPSLLDERRRQFPGLVGQGDRMTVDDVMRDQQQRRAAVPPEAGMSDSLYRLWEMSQRPGSPYSMLSQDQWYPSGLTAGVSPGGVRGLDSGGWGLAQPDVFQQSTPRMTGIRSGGDVFSQGLPSMVPRMEMPFSPPSLSTGFDIGRLGALLNHYSR